MLLCNAFTDYVADEFVPNKPKPEIDPDDDFWLDDEDMEEEMEDDMDSGDSSEEEYDDWRN